MLKDIAAQDTITERRQCSLLDIQRRRIHGYSYMPKHMDIDA